MEVESSGVKAKMERGAVLFLLEQTYLWSPTVAPACRIDFSEIGQSSDWRLEVRGAVFFSGSAGWSGPCLRRELTAIVME